MTSPFSITSSTPTRPPPTWVSPGSGAGRKLNQLLQTDTFVASILTNTTLSAQLSGDPSHDQVIKDVRGKLSVTSLGSNTVKITYAGSDPVLCQQVVQSTIDQYRSWDLTARVQQTAIEGQFYQKQLQIYQDQVDAATKRVNDFQSAHPFPDPSSPQYLELQGLQRDLNSARALLTATSAKIQQANAADSLSGSSSQYEFQILDARPCPGSPRPR